MGSIGSKKNNSQAQRLRNEAEAPAERDEVQITERDIREAERIADRVTRQLAAEGFFEGLGNNRRRGNRRNG